MYETYMEKAKQNDPKLFQTEHKTDCFGVPVPDNTEWFRYRFEKKEPPRCLSSGDEIYLDFGNHYTGYLSFVMNLVERYPDAPTKVYIKLAENLYELATDYSTYEGEMPSTWFQQETIYIDNPSRVKLSRRYAFRYIKLVVEAAAEPISFEDFTVTAVSSADITKCQPIEVEEQLRRLEQIGCRTLQNCMQRILEDGPKRDRRLWLGDLRLQALTSYYTFQNDEVIKRCLYLFAAYTDQGCRVPRDIFQSTDETYCHKEWLADYSLMFPICLCDYYEHRKDEEIINDLFELADEQLKIAYQATDEGIVKDLEELVEWWAFIDWCDGLQKVTSMQGILLYALKKMRWLCMETGRTEKAQVYETYITELQQAAKEKLYDSENGYFVNRYDKFQLSVHSQVWMILGDVIQGDEAKQLLQNTLNNKEAKGAVTPYMHHYVMEALLHVGMKEEALEYIKGYWGKMAEYGADTYWEVFVPGNFEVSPYGDPIMNSCCHAWSCSVSYFIRKYFAYQNGDMK